MTDFVTGRLIRASTATFVPFVIVERYTKTPDCVADYSKEQAAAFAAEQKSTMITWQQVMERAE